MSFAVFVATVTVTVYVWIDASPAVTVYVTGLVKSFGVEPLTCAVPPTSTLAPVVAKFATSALTLVPNGTVAVIEDPVIVAVTSAPRPELLVERNWYDVMSLELPGATV